MYRGVSKRIMRIVSVVLVVSGLICIFFFFFKQKTAYEIVDCDWSSDVCSSDLDERIKVIGIQIVHIGQDRRVRHPCDRDSLALVHEIGRASCRERV